MIYNFTYESRGQLESIGSLQIDISEVKFKKLMKEFNDSDNGEDVLESYYADGFDGFMRMLEDKKIKFEEVEVVNVDF